MSETPKTDALRALMAEIYEPDNAALDHMLEKYAELERETTRPEALRIPVIACGACRRTWRASVECPFCGNSQSIPSGPSCDRVGGESSCDAAVSPQLRSQEEK